MALNFPDPATQTPVNTFSPSSTPSASTNGITYLWDGQKWNAQTSGDAAFWQRVGTTLSPATVGDNISTTGDLTTADATVDTLTSNGLVDAPVGTFAGDVQVGSLNSGPLAGFRNQLINGSLTQWQRGTAAYTSGGSNFVYGSADRWGLFSDASGNSMGRSGTTNTPANGEFRYSIGIDPAATYVGQRVELLGSNGFRNGTTWSVSCYSTQPLEFFCRETNATVVQNWVAMTAVTTADANGFRRYHHQFTFAHDCDTASSGFLEVLFRVPGATLARAVGFQLEPGPVATPFEQRPIGTELALCQRYYQTVESKAFTGVCRLSSTIYANASLITEMRAAPDATGLAVQRFITGTGDFVQGGFASDAYTTSTTAVRVYFKSLSGLTIGHGASGSNSGSIIALDSEL